MSQATLPVRHTDKFYIDGQWAAPSSNAKISVFDSDTEQLYFTVPEGQAADISSAVGAAREAFDNGPWPRLTHTQRADYLRAIGAQLKQRPEDMGQLWPRESGVLYAMARFGAEDAEPTCNLYADPAPAARVAAHGELDAALPPGTARVTPAGRRAVLDERLRQATRLQRA
jgi:acyl-CoA reductase-like NAD-dependent aldehyde dehydrogenase